MKKVDKDKDHKQLAIQIKKGEIKVADVSLIIESLIVSYKNSKFHQNYLLHTLPFILL